MFNQVIYDSFLTNHTRSPIHGTLSENKLKTRLFYTKRRVHFTCNLQMPHDHFTDILSLIQLSQQVLRLRCFITQPKNDSVV